MLRKFALLLVVSGSPLPALMATTDNILLVNLDDVGLLDGLEEYAPNLAALENEGVYFSRCYSQPSCSPSRACVLTGLYGIRNGIGVALDDEQPFEKYLDPGLRTLSAALSDHHSVYLGKWHLGLINPHGPLNYGFDTAFWNHGNTEDFWASQFWVSNANPVFTVEAFANGYHTDVITNAAHASFQNTPHPYFVSLNFNDVHTPDDQIPETPGAPKDPALAKLWYLDLSVRRVLDRVDRKNTHVFVFGDNGWRQGFEQKSTKGSLYETSIRVPLWWLNPTGNTGRNDQLTMLTDLYATIIEVAGGAGPKTESDSFPLGSAQRTHCYADKFGTRPNGSVHDKACVVDERWKLHEDFLSEEIEFYDLLGDPGEDNDLTEGEMTEEQLLAFLRMDDYLVGARGTTSR